MSGQSSKALLVCSCLIRALSSVIIGRPSRSVVGCILLKVAVARRLTFRSSSRLTPKAYDSNWRLRLLGDQKTGMCLADGAVF